MGTQVTTQANHRLNLWWLVASPAIWAAHFLASYFTIAIGCAKFGSLGQTADFIRMAIACYTLIALVIMAWVGRTGYYWRRTALKHHEGTAEDSTLGRTGFLGFATLLLTGLSITATIFVALTAWFIRSCQ